MVKRKIKETVLEYDEGGKIIKETITETTEDDDTMYLPSFNPYPYYPVYSPDKFWCGTQEHTSPVVN